MEEIMADTAFIITVGNYHVIGLSAHGKNQVNARVFSGIQVRDILAPYADAAGSALQSGMKGTRRNAGRGRNS